MSPGSLLHFSVHSRALAAKHPFRAALSLSPCFGWVWAADHPTLTVSGFPGFLPSVPVTMHVDWGAISVGFVPRFVHLWLRHKIIFRLLAERFGAMIAQEASRTKPRIRAAK